MEYYSGILFLTTNRPGQLDEAIKSRVHCVLLYKTLTHNQMREIFSMNIERLEYIEERRRKAASDDLKGYLPLQADTRGLMNFADKHWTKHNLDERGRWNGRQIRNAFISAAALARSEANQGGGDEDKLRVAVLTDRHFETVASSITAFDKYMAAAHNNARDAQRAADRLDRFDRFNSGDDSDSPTPSARRQARNDRSARVSGTARTVPATARTVPATNHPYMPPSPQPVPVPPSPYYALHQPQQPVFSPPYPQQEFASRYPYALQVPDYATAGDVPSWPPQTPHPHAVQSQQHHATQASSNLSDPRMLATSAAAAAAAGATTRPLWPGVQGGGVGGGVRGGGDSHQLGGAASAQDGRVG